MPKFWKIVILTLSMIISSSSFTNQKGVLEKTVATFWKDLKASEYVTLVSAISFSPNGNRLLSGDSDGNTVLWDFDTSRPTRAIVHDRGDITVDFENLKKQNPNISLTVLKPWRGPVQKASFYPDGNHFVVGYLHSKWIAGTGVPDDTFTGQICIFQTETGKLKMELGQMGGSRFNKRVYAIPGIEFALSSDGKYLVKEDDSLFSLGVIVYNLNDGHKLKFLTVDQTPRKLDIGSLSFTPDSKQLVVCCSQSRAIDIEGKKVDFPRKLLLLVDCSRWEVIEKITLGWTSKLGWDSNLWRAVVSPDGDFVASPNWHSIELINLKTKSYRELYGFKNEPSNPFGKNDYFSHVAFSPNGELFVGGGHFSGQAVLVFMDTSTWQIRQRVLIDCANTRSKFTNPSLAHSSSDKHTIGSLAFSPDGTTLAVGTSDGVIKLWKVLEND